MTEKNYFDELYRVDVSGHIEKKNGFSYVSWSFAVAELRKRYPQATWEVKRFDGKPFLHTECGYFVEVSVTISGVTLSQIHPVLDNRNRPIQTPDAFHINTSIQRALVKAIALHGLGLCVYAGEDLPPDVKAEKEAEAAKPISTEQVKELVELIERSGADYEAFLKYFKVTDVAQMPADKFAKAKSALLKKAEAA